MLPDLAYLNFAKTHRYIFSHNKCHFLQFFALVSVKCDCLILNHNLWSHEEVKIRQINNKIIESNDIIYHSSFILDQLMNLRVMCLVVVW